MVARPRRTPCKVLRLACWNADGVRGRKLELEQFLSEHGFDICLLNETLLVAERALRFANYVCHQTDRPTPGGGTAIIVHKGIDHYAVPVSGLQYLEATAIHLVLATRPVKLVSAYLALTRPLIDSDGNGWEQAEHAGIYVISSSRAYAIDGLFHLQGYWSFRIFHG
jgi:hypothetical protein